MQQTIEVTSLRELKSETIDETAALQLERDQIVHAISLATHNVRLLRDSIVRRNSELRAFDKAIDGMSEAFDGIVNTTDRLVNYAHGINPGGNLSDSESEGEEVFGGQQQEDEEYLGFSERDNQHYQQPQVQLTQSLRPPGGNSPKGSPKDPGYSQSMR